MTVVDRIDLRRDQVHRRARQVNVARLMALIVGGLFVGLGWVVAKLVSGAWIGIVWVIAAFLEGWDQGWVSRGSARTD